MAPARLRIFVVCAVGAVVAALALAPTSHAAGTLSATFSKDSDWGTGYQGKFTITNGTGATVNGWTLAFTLAGGQTLGTFWDATLSVGAGNRVTAVARSYNATLAPGAVATFGDVVGYTGSGAAPTGCTVNGASCGGGPATTSPPTTAPPTTVRHHQPAAPPGGLPRHLLTGYWQDFVNGATPLRLSGFSSDYDIVAVAGLPLPVR